MCTLPELLRKWYTRPTTANYEPQKLKEDSGLWCHCKQKKGGDMIGCEKRSCPAQWFTWNVSACLHFPMANGTVEHVSLIESAKP